MRSIACILGAACLCLSMMSCGREVPSEISEAEPAVTTTTTSASSKTTVQTTESTTSDSAANSTQVTVTTTTVATTASTVTTVSSTDSEGVNRTLSVSEQLAGLFDGTVAEVMMDDGLGGSFAMHFPDMVWVGDTIYAYYISYPASSHGCPCIGLATSKDGVIFDKVSDAVIVAGPEAYDVRMASFPGVWYEGGVFYVVYESTPHSGAANIALATSTDGIHFTKQGLILEMDPSLNWQNINIGTPDLFKKDGVWYLTFHGYGTRGYDCQIGLAFGTELKMGSLTMLKEPILPTSADPSAPDSGTTGRRDLTFDKESGYFYMVYEVSTDRVGGDFSGSRWNHAFARSKDMVDWERTGPFLERVSTGFGYDGPNFLKTDDQVYVYMRNRSNNTTRMWLIDKTFTEEASQ